MKTSQKPTDLKPDAVIDTAFYNTNMQINPELFFYNKDKDFYVFSPKNPNIVKISKKLFDILQSNKLKELYAKSKQKLLELDVLQASSSKKIKPSILTLKVTCGCNFNCAFCSQKGIPINAKNMDWSIAKFSVDKYMELEQDCYNIGFFGGEPLLNAELIRQIIDYTDQTYTSHKVNYEINTNGFLLEDNLDWIDTKNIMLAVSARGNKTYYEEHDKIEKYEKIKSAIKKYKNKDNVVLSIVIDKTNIDTVAELMDDFGSEGIDNFALCIPSFELEKNWGSINKSKVIARKIMALFKKSFDDNKKLIFSDWGFWTDKKRNCRALSGTSIYVNTDGTVNLCHSSPVVLGNIKNDSLTELSVKEEKLPDYIKKELKYCETCDIVHFCKGGCIADKNFKREKDKTFCEFAHEFFKLYICYLIER